MPASIAGFLTKLIAENIQTADIIKQNIFSYLTTLYFISKVISARIAEFGTK